MSINVVLILVVINLVFTLIGVVALLDNIKLLANIKLLGGLMDEVVKLFESKDIK